MKTTIRQMIKIIDLNISFKKEIIYKDFSLSVSKGEKLAITGESGKGKSTLLNLLAGFIPNFNGQVTVNDTAMNSKTINEIRKIIAWLPQETSLNLKTVDELLFAPFEFALNRKKRPAKEEITDIFKVFELSETLLTKKLTEISGGQKQRIILASCLLMNKPLLLIDEPTSALDKTIKKKVADYILTKQDLTVIAATHDDYWIKKSEKILHLE